MLEHRICNLTPIRIEIRPGATMKIYITFDVEIWCGGWDDLDSRFGPSFDRYVYGRSDKGAFALPKTLEIMDHHGIKGVFFVESLFAARFGLDSLATVVNLIRSGNHDIQQHLHPEWTDEIRPLPFAGAVKKRQHLCFYEREEQAILIALGRKLLGEVGVNVRAFRAGSFAANRDTYRALRDLGIGIDSSLHAVLPCSGVDLRDHVNFEHPLELEDTKVYPLSVFRDGLGSLRPAQLGACSFAELRDAMESAAANGCEHFVILSHNFEMLKLGRTDPDPIVVKRFEQLCEFLGANRSALEMATFATPLVPLSKPPERSGQAGFGATLRRHGEQLVRRFY